MLFNTFAIFFMQHWGMGSIDEHGEIFQQWYPRFVEQELTLKKVA
jgi:hypothetical protein